MEDKVFKKSLKKLPIGYEDSSVFVCGKNDHFELTFENLTHITSPLGIELGKTHRISQISIRGNHCGFLTSHGKLFMSGSNLFRKLGFES